MHNVYYVRHSRMRCSAHSPLFVCDGQRMSFQKFDSLRYSVNKFSAGCTVHWTTRAKQSHMNEGSGRHTICCDTYLLTPWCRVLPEQLTGLQLVKKLPEFHGTPKVRYRTHKRTPPVSILGQSNPVHILFACCAMLPLETLLPGDPSGGVVYLRTVLSPEQASHM